MSGVVIKLDDDDEEEDDDVAELLAGDDSLDSDEDSTRYLTTLFLKPNLYASGRHLDMSQT